jgi:hypothetical protein
MRCILAEHMGFISNIHADRYQGMQISHVGYDWRLLLTRGSVILDNELMSIFACTENPERLPRL